jgi:uncharacterized membrane protein
MISFSSFSQTNFTITLNVKDSQGNAVKDYQVKVLNSALISKNNTTSLVFLSKGIYDLIISGEGFAEKFISIHVAENKKLDVQLDVKV